MARMKTVWAEVNGQGEPIRILKFAKQRWKLPEGSVKEFTKKEAVESIRLKVFAKANCTPEQSGECMWCSRGIIWEKGHLSSGHLHEQIPRGKVVFQGPEGEYSITNSVAICRDCHLGKDGAHGNRLWQTAKLKEQK